MSDIINYRDNTHVITDYRYDSFGRRIHTAERTKSGMRTIYDGLSFEVVKEAETFLGTRGITSSATGEANLTNYNPHGSDHTRGTRYYFIRDRGQELRTGKSGEALPDRTKGVRTYLYLNDERIAVNNLYNTNHGQYYYGSDILGSVKFVTGQGGQELKRIEYDIFGGIYKGNSPYGLETGYTGKPYDAVTGLSDYGVRDYSSAHARFITEDPIRDGENWFSYVGNNPVNWIDPWGLSASEKKKQDITREHDLDTLQTVLDLVGVIPGVGDVVDIANAAISLARGNYSDAALSALSALPLIGDAIGKGGKAAKKIARAVKRADNVVDTVKTTQNISKIVRHRIRKPAGSNHGNSLTTTKPAQGYALRDISTDKVLKYGETTRENKRYSKKYLKGYL